MKEATTRAARNIRESTIEAKVKSLAQDDGWLTYKFVSPNQRGVPDRIFIKDGRIVFIEFKAPKRVLSALQMRTTLKMIAAGAEVHVCDSVEKACDALGI